MPDPIPEQDPELMRELALLAERAGIALPNVSRFAPTVGLSLPMRQLALELGSIASRHDIYRKGLDIVTVEPDSGEWRRMTPLRFMGWIEQFCAFKVDGRGSRTRESLSREEAAAVLEQDIFRQKLRPLLSVHQMRLPVKREDGTVEFLAPGYDAGSQVFTAKGIEYPMDWSLADARDWLDSHGENYEWSWPSEDRQPVATNRSWSVVVLGMLAVFCKAVFTPGTTRPMIAGVANQPGTGKSTLVAMMTTPVFGTASTNKIPKNDEIMDKELDTVSMNGREYLFFDDIGSGIFSHPLNAFITSSSRTGRALGGNDDFFGMQVCQVFATGNDIKLSADLMRRALVFELFLAGEVRGRKFPFVISSKYLSSMETRKKFLAALCAIVKHGTAWLAQAAAEGKPLPEVGALESFEEWSVFLARIAVLAGYTNPLAPPELASGGAEEEDEMKEFLIKVATGEEWNREFSRVELANKARELGLLEALVGTDGDKDLDSGTMKKWGRQLQRWRGRTLVDERKRRFQFSHRRQKRGKKYPLSFPDQPATPPSSSESPE